MPDTVDTTFFAPTQRLLAQHSGVIEVKNFTKIPWTILSAKDLTDADLSDCHFPKSDLSKTRSKKVDQENESESEDRFIRELAVTISWVNNAEEERVSSGPVVLEQVIGHADISLKTNGERYLCFVYRDGSCDLLAFHMLDQIPLSPRTHSEAAFGFHSIGQNLLITLHRDFRYY
jgi:hypothetical protein